MSNLCLYDHLPIGLRQPSSYSSLFTPLPASTLAINPNEGVFATLHGEMSLDASYFQSGPLVYRTSRYGQTRVFDVEAGCAVDLHPQFRDLKILHEQRIVTMVDYRENQLLIWREDSLNPLRLTRGIEGFSGNLKVSADRVSLEKKDLDRSNFKGSNFSRFLSFPIRGNFTLQSSNSVEGSWLTRQGVAKIRDGAGNLSLLTEAGKARLFSFFRGEPLMIQEKLDSMRKNPTANQQRLLDVSEYGNYVGNVEGTFDVMLQNMGRLLPQLSDIVASPFDEWLPSYLAILDTISG